MPQVGKGLTRIARPAGATRMFRCRPFLGLHDAGRGVLPGTAPGRARHTRPLGPNEPGEAGCSWDKATSPAGSLGARLPNNTDTTCIIHGIRARRQQGLTGRCQHKGSPFQLLKASMR